jgi:hypothetical protein
LAEGDLGALVGAAKMMAIVRRVLESGEKAEGFTDAIALQSGVSPFGFALMTSIDQSCSR